MSVQGLDRLVRQVAAQVRWRRVEHYGLRGAFYGALAAVGLLIFKQSLGPAAVPAALAVLCTGVWQAPYWAWPSASRSGMRPAWPTEPSASMTGWPRLWSGRVARTGRRSSTLWWPTPSSGRRP